MAVKNEQVEIIVDNKSYKLSGVENEKYIRSIAEYIDKKIKEIAASAIGIAKNSSAFLVLVAINIADDYFKEKDSVKGRLKKAAESFADEINNLKIEKEATEKKLSDAMNEIIRLNTISENDTLIQKAEIYEREYEALKIQMKDIKLELNKAKSQLGSAKTELEKHKEEKNKHRNELDQLNDMIMRTESEKEELRTALEAVKNENSMLRDGFDKLKSKLEEKTDDDRITRLEAELERVREEARLAQEDAQNSRNLVEQVKAEAEQAKAELTEYIETFGV